MSEEKWICSSCKAENTGSGKFCLTCGAPRFGNFMGMFQEEPEENLFPSTQYELVKWMAKQINTTQGNSLCIATHSPYILSSFNNLIQAADNKDSKVVETVVGKSAAIQFEDINVYAVDNGTVKDIKDYDLRLIFQTDLDAASDTISSDFSKLLES